MTLINDLEAIRESLTDWDNPIDGRATIDRAIAIITGAGEKPAPFDLRTEAMRTTGTTQSDWQSGSRRTAVVRGKRMLAYLLRTRLDMSLIDAAYVCYWGSHDSVMGAVRTIGNDPEQIKQAAAIYTRCQAGVTS